MTAKLKGLEDLIPELGDEELERLAKRAEAELMERDLTGRSVRRNGTESEAESRGTPGGQSTPAPAREIKIRANGRGVNPGWEWQTVKVACGECRGRGERRTLLDGVPYPCKRCKGRGELELTVPVLRCPECQGPADERVMAGMKCEQCAYGKA